MQNGEEPAYPIASVDNALRLLLLFRTRDSIRIADASDELGVVRSTAHRLLAMLRYHGFVDQDPQTKAYRPGPVLSDLGFAAIQQLEIRAFMRPHLERLAAVLEETAHLVLLNGREIRIVDGIESSRALHTAARIGVSLPAHATAGGKVLLADLSEAELLDRYPDPDLPRAGARSITSRAALIEELAKAREQGYAVSIDEATPDVGAVAVPVRDSFGTSRAALAISAPVARLERTELDRVVAALASEAAAATPKIA
jgi:IclR family transcriptional regulator, acetate operon repressor